ncbi:hypothetical protein TNCV_4343711, partial [Trichonephila clavipes]
PKREIWRSPNVFSSATIVARASVDMLRRLVGTTAPGHMIVQFRNEKVSNHGSITIPIDCNVVAFIVFGRSNTDQ